MSTQNEDVSVAERRALVFGSTALIGLSMAARDAKADVNQSTPLPSYFDVTSYGAIPSQSNNSNDWWGMPDCSGAFNNAIAAATQVGGGIIFVPRGRYVLRYPVFIRSSNIRIIGEGRGTTTLLGIGVQGAIISFNATTSDHQIVGCGVENLTFLGSSTPRAAFQCLALYNTSKSSFSNIDFGSNLDLTNGSALLYIANSWINHFYDLHFTGNAPYASLRIERSAASESSNSLHFYGCNFLSNGTPNGVVIDGSGAEDTGDVYNFSGVTMQGYSVGRGIWMKRGQALQIQSYYGEDNLTDIRLGDSSSPTPSYASTITIDNWRTLRAFNSIYLDMCRNVKIGMGIPQQSRNAPILVGSITGGFIFGRNIKANQDAPNSSSPPFIGFKQTSYNGTATGLMIFDGDAQRYPDWPTAVNPMGIIMKPSNSATFGKHFKIYVDDSGSVRTQQYIVSNGYLVPG